MANIGYCGDDCELCPRYIATESNDREKLKEAAFLWKKVGLTDQIVTPEEMICNGCASLEKCHYNDIRECVRDKEISNCGKCNDYPCDKINEVFEKTSSYAQKCKETCASNDYECLNKAFFLKKNRLDAIHLECITDVNKGS
ncbi:MAG: DUF3795 domain-containing protein [Desulfobacterales bacterium]|nr:DUF3795 domain-containing protein [Desulfobacterales bacterium]